MKDKISIIVPVYNAEKYLDLCINSLLNQTHKNIEIILVNDGSKDSSLSICKKYAQKDERIVVIDKENTGVSDTRNTGLKAATGDFIMFCDSDDCAAENWCSDMIIAYKEDNLLMCDFKRVKSNKMQDVLKDGVECSNIETEYIDRKDFMFHRTEGFGSPTTKIFFKKIIDDNDIKFPDNLFLGEDLAFVLQYLSAIHGDIIHIANPLYYYRQTENETLSKRAPTFAQCEEFSEILESSMKKLGVTNEEAWKLVNTTIMYDYEKAFVKIIHDDSLSFLKKYRQIKKAMNAKAYKTNCQKGRITTNSLFNIAYSKRCPLLLTFLMSMNH